ncbi:MAG: tRNA (guanosine(37)-N1)-methyltransferase TrmD [Candidatus Paceibacterota bacterium]
MIKFHIITIFPQMFDSYLKESIIGRAIKDKKIKIKFYNPMDFCLPRPGRRGGPTERVDDKPYGGGPGMVLRPELFLKAFAQASRSFSQVLGKNPQTIRKTSTGSRKIKVIIFSPSGKKFDTAYAKKSAKKYTDIIMISGRYEGIDARVRKIINADLSAEALAKVEEISIGDYVLTGGELPAMVMIDSISRQIRGVLGKYESLEEERISSSEVYTRPEILKYRGKNYKVPKVLLSGNHKKIDEWKSKNGK